MRTFKRFGKQAAGSWISRKSQSTRRGTRSRGSVENLESRQLLTSDTGDGFWEGDDGSPAVSVFVSDAWVSEDAGAAQVAIRALGPIGATPITVTYRTLDDSARAHDDYVPVEGSVVLDQENPSRIVSIPLVNDNVPERANETFFLEIMEVLDAAKWNDRGTVTVRDDDIRNWPTLTISGESIDEGNEGTRPLTITFQLSSPATTAIQIPYETADGVAKAGEDYIAQSGTVNFAPGESVKTVSVQIVGDTTAEVDEYFTLSVNTNVEGLAGGYWSAYPMIHNDDRFEVPDLSLEKYSSEEELENALLDRAVAQYQHLFGTRTNWPWSWWGPWVYADAAEGGVLQGNSTSTRSHSETNVQEAGVDEGDIMETDGDYIYVISQNELLIFQALPADQMSLVSRTLLHEWPQEMYLDGDRLTIVSSGFNYYGRPWGPWFFGGAMVDFAGPIWWPGEPTPSTVTVFDISNRESPEIVQKVELDGTVQSSRMIGGQLYLVMQNGIDLPQPLYYEVDPNTNQPKPEPVDPNTIVWDGSKTYQYETEAQYRARVGGTIAQDSLPTYTSRGANPEDPNAIAGLISEATDIYKPLLPEEMNLTSVVTIDTRSEGPEEVQATSIFSNYTSTTYVSTSNIYLTTAYYPRWDVPGWAGEWTAILKFSIGENGTELAAAGGVNGRVLNQFSLGEHENHLRIATTENWGTRAKNNVYVLGEDGDDLVVTGAIEDIAAGETIFSARFLGDRGYVVTFRRIDPLFALDLSDPTKPEIAAELKLPGFSEYLQPLSEDYLLGIGRDADPVTGMQRGVQLSLFNVSDITNPTVADQYTFTDEAWWSWTPAAYEHHAVGYYPEYDTLAMPITSGGEEVPVDWDNDGHVDYTYFQPRSALWVFDVDLDASRPDIDVRGTIEHGSDMRRSVRVDDILYAISYDAISSHPIDDPETTLAEVNFMRNWVGIQIDAESAGGDNLLILGGTGREIVELAPTTGGRFRVSMNGEDRGEFDGDAVANVLANGVAGPDRLVLSDVEGLPDNILASNMSTRLTGDYDGDGLVDIDDFNLLKSRMGSAIDDALIDIDGDGVYGLAEFNALKANFGASASEAVSNGGFNVTNLNLGALRFAVAADFALAEG